MAALADGYYWAELKSTGDSFIVNVRGGLYYSCGVSTSKRELQFNDIARIIEPVQRPSDEI